MLTVLILLQAAAQAPLNLSCVGGGTANKVASARAWASNGASVNVLGQRQQDFGDQVDVRLFAGDDRIRMPRTMLPVVHGGNDGWFKLKNVQADERSIRGSVAVNAMNNPKMFIDRVTGTISISGKAGDYSGRCQAVDASAAPKF